MTIKTFFAVALLAGSGLVQAAPNLVTNGSFESGAGGLGSFSGWQATLGDPTTFVDSSGQTGSHPGQASSGLWSAYFGSTAADGGASISQQLATAVGQTYLLSFDLANDNGGLGAVNAFAALVGGTLVQSFTNLGVQDYAHEQLSFTATAASTLLSFRASNDNGYLQLDNVVVTAVPEPITAAMMVAGLATMGLWMSSRRG